nr:helix-hairpin-helix domain-containing protein [uncultured Desulfobulbus sp.]
MAIPITEIKGIGPKTAHALTEHGYSTAEDLAAAQPGTLAAIPGFGAVLAGREYTGQVINHNCSG